MTKDERIQGLLQANNRLVDQRRELAQTLRRVRETIGDQYPGLNEVIDMSLSIASPR